MSSKRVLVCGSREYTDRRKIYEELDKLAQEHELVIIEGDARGADRIAGEWAKAHAMAHHKFPANWRRYGNAAGPIRNKQMLEQGFPDLVLAFGGLEGRGTNNMISIAKKAGVPVEEFDRG